MFNFNRQKILTLLRQFAVGKHIVASCIQCYSFFVYFVSNMRTLLYQAEESDTVGGGGDGHSVCNSIKI